MQKKRQAKLQQQVKDIQHLDSATQAIIMRIDKNDRRLRISGFITLAILLIVGIIGIYHQNQLAQESKQHIDCIIKLTETPLGAGDRSKYIDNLNNTCRIRFTQ